MKRLFVVILFLTSCIPVYSSETDGKSLLQRGKSELDKKQFQTAVAHLSAAERGFPLLGDYALLWLSDAYHGAENHEDSLNTVRTLLKKYPHSLLIKKARIREIKEAEELSENTQRLFEAFLKDYPDDTEMKYLFAQWLSKNGQKDRAKPLFKDIYISAGEFSRMAHEELCASDISAKDLLRRASNLINRMDYRGAESALRSALAKDEEGLKREILQNLGLALFRQKRYEEAAAAYKKVNDRYWEIRALFRAGEKETIDAAMDELLVSRDRRIGSVLTAVASDKRRAGYSSEAVRLYQKIIDRYPSEREDALWGIGWTHFLGGNYTEAFEVFSKLYTTYGAPKYLYWKARSREAGGENATDLYNALLDKERDFYGLMTYKRIKSSPGSTAKEQSKQKFRTATPVKTASLKQKKNNRVEALIDLGFLQEALSELLYMSKDIGSPEDIVYACIKFQELGRYDSSIRLAKKLPSSENIHQFLYPRPYWSTIAGISERYDIDPLLVLSIVREESRFDSEARSIAGALGLMQIMPKTASRLNSKLGLGIEGTHEILNAKNNLHLGTYYLSRLVKEFGSYAYAIAAYNAGEEIVKKWLHQRRYRSADEFIEDIPYEETRNYVKRVLTSLFEYKRISAAGDGTVDILIEKL